MQLESRCPSGIIFASITLLPACDGTSLPVHLLRFDSSQFTPHEFGRWRIACPDIVARSVHKRQAEFFFGRFAARRALEHAGVDTTAEPSDVAIGRAGEPIWPTSVFGSISHTVCLAAAAVLPGRRCGIGIDIEHVPNDTFASSFWDIAVGPPERAKVYSQSGSISVSTLLTAVFSAKEAFFKGAFAAVGRFFDFGAVHLIGVDTVRGRLRLRLTQTLSRRLLKGQEYEVGFRLVDDETVITYFVW